jgi:peroxiredoxin
MADPTVSLAVPHDGPPTVECGAFLESPRRAPHEPGSRWDETDPGLAPRGWRVVGTEIVLGTACLKLVGTQESPEWSRPRADRPAWRRVDTFWIAPRLGIAQKVERIIEHREPARLEVSHRLVLTYDLQSSLTCLGGLAEDRRQEIEHTLRYRNSAAPLLLAPVRYTRQLAALAAKIQYHLENQPPTPYRDAVVEVGRLVEAARRGEAPPALPVGPGRPTVAVLGEVAPDFSASDFTNPGKSAHLRNWHGRPILLVFYNPSSPTATDLLRFAQGLNVAYARQLHVVGLSVVDDGQAVLAQRQALGLTFPVLFGGGLRTSYDVESTPKVMVIDSSGVVRAAFLGWGREMPSEVMAELRPWLAVGRPR